MKKIVLSLSLVLIQSMQSARSQGYAVFQTPTRGTWDLFTSANSGTAKLGATMNVTFLWGTGPALITSIGITTPTNNLASQPIFSPAQAWYAILNDPNYHLGIDGNTAVNPIVANAAAGSASYNSAGTFPLAGTTAGSTVGIYVIAWDKTYATPAAASAVGAAVGWSSIFQYATGVNSIATPLTFSASGFVPFGVPLVPEPATITFASLGLAAMLVIRRRKY